MVILYRDSWFDVNNNILHHFNDLRNLIKVANSCTNPAKPTCVDLLWTNSYRIFHSSWAIAIGWSDFHKMTVTVSTLSWRRSVSYRNQSIDLLHLHYSICPYNIFPDLSAYGNDNAFAMCVFFDNYSLYSRSL